MSTRTSTSTNESDQSKLSRDLTIPTDSLPESQLQDVGPQLFSNPYILPKIKPFKATKSYGINTKCGIVNLSKERNIQVIFGAAHLGVLYDYCKNTYQYFEGHQNEIISLSCDDSGSFLASCDSGEDACIIVWNIKHRKPVYTIFDLYPKSGCLCLRISYDAKYLISIGLADDEENYAVDLWVWSCGLTKPHNTLNVKVSYGKPRKICFNPTLIEHIMFIFEKQVIFAMIDPEKKEFTQIVYPHITFKKQIGKLLSGTYIEKRHRCFATSQHGHVLIFANTLYLRAYTEGNLNNAKIYLKAVKISQSALIDCRGLEELIVLGDEDGRIYFTDLSLTIKYYYEKQKFSGLVSLSFNLVFTEEDRRQRVQNIEDIMADARHSDAESDYTNKTKLVEEIEEEELSDEIQETEIGQIEDRCEEIFNQVHSPPSDYTIERKPVNAKPFFVLTQKCGLFYVEYFKDIPFPVFPCVESSVTSIDVHAQLPLIIIGYENGLVQLKNYEKEKIVAEKRIPVTDTQGEWEKPEAINCIKYSPECLHLICCNNIGEIYVLDTILLNIKVKKPLRFSNGRIMKLVFNFDSSQFAYYDFENTVVIFQYNSHTHEWVGLGKLMPHYLPINDMLFISEYHNSTLVTIGEDRCIVKYNNVGLEVGMPFDITIRERIEQSAIPKSFVYYMKNVGDDFLGYYTIADDQYKFKSINDLTMMTRQVALGPAYGAFKGHYISKLILPESLEYRYYVFKMDKQIGLQKAILDGNPYGYVGFKAHPTAVTDFAISGNGKYLFTFSEGSQIIFMWEICPKAAELVYLLGGREFEPYYCLLEGGKNGWLFQEIQDLFFYMQILHQGENVVLPRKFSDTIDISELPDLVRACGYYPSEFEIENLMIEARYKNIDETSEVNEEISFFEFLKIYVNHRPAHGYSIDELSSIYETISKMPCNYGDETVLLRQEYLSILTDHGEEATIENLRKCFSRLFRIDDAKEDTEIFPEYITFDILVKDILGIDMNREKVEDEETEN